MAEPQPPSNSGATVAGEPVKLDFSRDMSYGDYLHLDEILGAQHLRSGAHDEMLFIVQHQTTELWMKLLLHELAAAVQCVARDELGSAFKMLARASILKALPSSSRVTHCSAAPSSCSSSFIHSSLVWCWMMNSISLWLGERGCCAPRISSRCR